MTAAQISYIMRVDKGKILSALGLSSALFVCLAFILIMQREHPDAP